MPKTLHMSTLFSSCWSMSLTLANSITQKLIQIRLEFFEKRLWF
jgi:hypothetical protein